MNVLSKRRVKKFGHCFEVVEDDVLVLHSDKDSKQRSSQVVLSGTLNIRNNAYKILKIRNHTYKSNSVVAKLEL